MDFKFFNRFKLFYIFSILLHVYCRSSGPNINNLSRYTLKFVNGPNTLPDSRSEENASCYTDQGEEGKCLPLEDCPEIVQLLRSEEGRLFGENEFLRRRLCRKKVFYSKYKAFYCCPDYITEVRNPILPKLNRCGISSAPRITNGENFLHGTHPWLVGIGYKKDSTSLNIDCGGTLITKRHVLTAAHCFTKTINNKKSRPLTHVILGEHSLYREIERPSPIIIRIAEKKNLGYNDSVLVNDIELLKLENDVSFDYYIQPICLPFKEHLKYFDLENKKLIIAGWGATTALGIHLVDTPSQANVSVIPLTDCQNSFKNIRRAKIDSSQICLGGGGSDTCRGDSGGPAIYRDEGMFNKHFLIGITSYGDMNCGTDEHPGVYTFVPAFMDWILKNLD